MANKHPLTKCGEMLDIAIAALMDIVEMSPFVAGDDAASIAAEALDDIDRLKRED